MTQEGFKRDKPLGRARDWRGAKWPRQRRNPRKARFFVRRKADKKGALLFLQFTVFA
jgi:hypothetical protein